MYKIYIFLQNVNYAMNEIIKLLIFKIKMKKKSEDRHFSSRFRSIAAKAGSTIPISNSKI